MVKVNKYLCEYFVCMSQKSKKSMSVRQDLYGMELKSCKSCWRQELIMRQFNFEQRITMIRRAALGKLAVTPRGDALSPPL